MARYFLLGVKYEGATLSFAEIYMPSGTPGSGIFAAVGSMVSRRIEYAALGLIDGTVLLTDGFNYNNSSNALASAEVYTPSSPSFNQSGNMTAARADQTSSVLYNGQILIAGGEATSTPSGCGFLSSDELYSYQ